MKELDFNSHGFLRLARYGARSAAGRKAVHYLRFLFRWSLHSIFYFVIIHRRVEESWEGLGLRLARSSAASYKLPGSHRQGL